MCIRDRLKTNEENAYKLGAKEYVTLDVTQEYYEKSLKYMVFCLLYTSFSCCV